MEVATPGPASDRAPRRRRTPEQARAEILDAAHASLVADPVNGLTISAVMARTSLTRKSFYVHFRDRGELIEALVRPLRTDADEALRQWRDSADPVAAGRRALAGAAYTYRLHNRMLRAIFWSGADDEASRGRALLVDPVVDVATAIVRRVAPDLTQPRSTAEALVTMNVYRMLALSPEASDAEVEGLVETLFAIWVSALTLRRTGVTAP